MAGKRHNTPRVDGQPARKPGPPSAYSDEHAAQILSRVSGGEPLAQVCRDIGPNRSVVYDWAHAHPEFDTALKRARLDGEEAIAADALRIADTPQLGVIEKVEPVKGKNGRTRLVVTERRHEDMLGHRKLQVWTRLQLLAKWNPTKWGDRVQHANDPENPLPAPQFIIQPVQPTAPPEDE